MRIFSDLAGAASSLYSGVKRVLVGYKKENVYIVDKDAPQDVDVELPHEFAAAVSELNRAGLNK